MELRPAHPAHFPAACLLSPAGNTLSGLRHLLELPFPRFSLIRNAIMITYAKYKCRLKTKELLRKGKIVKSKTCSLCGGKERIHAHHPDYKKPSLVVWLCHSCHLKGHHKEVRENPKKRWMKIKNSRKYARVHPAKEEGMNTVETLLSGIDRMKEREETRKILG